MLPAPTSEPPRPQRSGPRTPRVLGCTPAARDKLLAAYRLAFGWVRQAAQWLRGFAASKQLARTWASSMLSRTLGPFSMRRVRRLVRLVRRLLDRFAHGFEERGGRRPTTLACLPASYHRCRTGLLGNASIYGTLRFCPRLLERDVTGVAKVVLHEMMHQRLGVDDQRHEECTGSKDRCYRESARTLVASGRYDLAVRNIDNYVALIHQIGVRG